MDSIEQLIGRRLKEARINTGYTQNDLAEKSRLSISTISRIENGHMLCGIETLLGLCSLLDVGIDFLLMDFIADANTPNPICKEILNKITDLPEAYQRHILSTVTSLIQAIQKQNTPTQK